MSAGRVVFITGKGGVGKTTVTAALGAALASSGARVLVVETASDGSLAHLFERQRFPSQPSEAAPGVYGVAVEAEHLIREYFSRLLRVPFLADRLLQSVSFRALTTAAPGVREFLLLERIAMWVEPSFWRRRQRFDFVLVDGPATGHMHKLLRVPRQLLNLVVAGPLRRTALYLEAVLGDPNRCLVVPVTMAEELAIEETRETWAVLRQELFLNVSRPVVNRIFPRRFSRAEAQEIVHSANGGPLIEAARYAIAMREEAQQHVRRLHQITGKKPIVLPEHVAGPPGRTDLVHMGRRLAQALFSDAGWWMAKGGREEHAHL